MKRPWMLVITGVLIVVALIIVFSGGDEPAFETVIVTRGNVSEEVSATGSVKPVSNVDLAFEKGGRIASVRADVGDRVYVGEPIVVLEKSELEAQLSRAEADLANRKADLDKANVDLANYFGGISDVLNDGYAKADDAVRKQLDALFTNDELQNPSLSFSTKDIAVDNDVRNLRIMATGGLNQWLGELSAIKNAASYGDLSKYLENAAGYLSTIRSLLLKAMDAVVNASESSLSSSSADSYKANINTGRTNVNTAISGITSRKQSIGAQEAAITSIEASIKSYEAGIQNIKAQISKATIYSPIAGVVTVQNAKAGEIAAAGSAMVSIISANMLEIEAKIPEADIAKVKIGDQMEITLDTYGNDVIFEAKVSFIEPGETLVEGVATYKTKFQFSKRDDRVKSGMTANITIFTDKRENVLTIPQRVVTTKDGTKTVMIDLGNGKSEERVIKTGLRGVDGNVEVLEGLSEGERIISGNPL